MKHTTIRARGPAMKIPASDGSLTVSVPIRIGLRSRRVVVQVPSGAAREPSPVDTSRPWDSRLTPLQAALARAYRWLRALEAGEVGSISEMARREGVDFSYAARLVNLTTLAPEIIAAILDDTLPAHLTIHALGINTPLLWSEQRRVFEMA